MGETKPGADELRVRGILRQRGVGPDASLPPKPTHLPDGFEPRERDWLDDIIETPLPEAAPEPEPAASPRPAEARKPKPSAKKKRRRKRKRSKAGAARTAWDTRPQSPRQSLLDAWDQVPYRLKWLGYHSSAAYMGWELGAVDYATYVTAWIADTGLLGVQATFWYGAALATFLLYRRTRSWWWPVAWLTAIPACSTVAGVLLYAPTQ